MDLTGRLFALLLSLSVAVPPSAAVPPSVAVPPSAVPLSARDTGELLPLRISEGAPPLPDGRLEEPIWQMARAITDFLQRSPREGASPTESTSVRFAYTPSDLYVGVRCSDSRPAQVVGTTLRRDDFSLTEDDQFVVAIDSYADSRNGFFFSTNPLGARVDAQFFDEGDVFVDRWDGAWQVGATRDSLGWTAEFRIPFSTLRFRKAERDTMGVNLFRRVIRTNEELFSPPIPLRFAAGTPSVSLARRVVFEGIQRGRGCYVQPYVVGRREEERGSARTGSADAGVDVRWSPSSAFTANLSVNTDFAQVEADDRQINLSRVALFVPEKRGFFLENAGLFSFGVPSDIEIFFSRRIGLLDAPTGEAIEAPIRVGSKVTGRAGRSEYGALAVRTGEAHGLPAEDFVVARAKVALSRRSWLGAIATNRSRPDTAASAFGVDGFFRMPGEIAVSSFLAASAQSGVPLGAETSGWRVRVERGGEREAFHLEALDLRSGFDPAIGFLARSATRGYRAGIALPRYPGGTFLRRIAPDYRFERFDAHADEAAEEHHRITLGLDARSGDAVSLFAEQSLDRTTSEFAPVEGISVPAGEYREHRAGASFQTKPGRPLSSLVAADVGGYYGGTRTTLSATVSGKAGGHLRIGPEFERSWIHVDGRNAQPLVLRLRGDADFNVSTSLSAFAQYDNESEELGCRCQLRHIRREGTELLLVYSVSLHEESGADLQRQELVLKATWRLDL